MLANEEVIGGLSERGSHPVVRIPLRQWMLRITAYADRLENDLDGLDWPDSIKALQRNWIGRSTGAEVDFFIGTASARSGKPNPQEFKAWRNERAAAGFPHVPGDDVLRIFTTRPDTLYGATYMVIAPEHPLVERLTRPARRAAVQAYCEQAARKSDLDRTELAKEKTGVLHRLVSPPIRSTTGRFRSGWPTTCWSATAPARSWPCRRTTRAITSLPGSSSLPIDAGGRSGQSASTGDARQGAGRPKPFSPSRARPSTPAPTTASRPPRCKQKIAADLRQARAGPRRRSITSCAIGSSAGSIFGASRFRSCTNWTPTASPTVCCARCRPKNCRSICPR